MIRRASLLPTLLLCACSQLAPITRSAHRALEQGDCGQAVADLERAIASPLNSGDPRLDEELRRAEQCWLDAESSRAVALAPMSAGFARLQRIREVAVERQRTDLVDATINPALGRLAQRLWPSVESLIVEQQWLRAAALAESIADALPGSAFPQRRDALLALARSAALLEPATSVFGAWFAQQRAHRFGGPEVSSQTRQAVAEALAINAQVVVAGTPCAAAQGLGGGSSSGTPVTFTLTLTGCEVSQRESATMRQLERERVAVDQRDFTLSLTGRLTASGEDAEAGIPINEAFTLRDEQWSSSTAASKPFSEGDGSRLHDQARVMFGTRLKEVTALWRQVRAEQLLSKVVSEDALVEATLLTGALSPEVIAAFTGFRDATTEELRLLLLGDGLVRGGAFARGAPLTLPPPSPEPARSLEWVEKHEHAIRTGNGIAAALEAGGTLYEPRLPNEPISRFGAPRAGVALAINGSIQPAFVALSPLLAKLAADSLLGLDFGRALIVELGLRVLLGAKLGPVRLAAVGIGRLHTREPGPFDGPRTEVAAPWAGGGAMAGFVVRGWLFELTVLHQRRLDELFPLTSVEARLAQIDALLGFSLGLRGDLRDDGVQLWLATAGVRLNFGD